jgi:hypothetical protein
LELLLLRHVRVLVLLALLSLQARLRTDKSRLLVVAGWDVLFARCADVVEALVDVALQVAAHRDRLLGKGMPWDGLLIFLCLLVLVVTLDVLSLEALSLEALSLEALSLDVLCRVGLPLELGSLGLLAHLLADHCLSRGETDLGVAARLRLVGDGDFLFEGRGEGEDLVDWDDTLSDEFVGADELVVEEGESDKFNARLHHEGALIVPAGGLAAALADFAPPLLCAVCYHAVRVLFK